jgi:hypothetical protein
VADIPDINPGESIHPLRPDDRNPMHRGGKRRQDAEKRRKERESHDKDRRPGDGHIDEYA